MTATTRHTIAAALDTIDGIAGHASRPASVQAGDAWPLVDILSRPPEAPAVWQTTWRIVVLLSSDVGAATDMFDTAIPAVCEALSTEAYVDSAQPITIPTQAGDLYGVEITARSE